MYSTRYSCPILMKVQFSGQIFEEEIQKSNFMKIPPVEAELFHADRRTDVHDATKCPFSRFYERT